MQSQSCKTLSSNLLEFISYFHFFSTAMLVNENVLTAVATFLGKDPAKVREINLFKSGDTTHYGHLIDNDCLRRCWDGCLKQSNYFEARQQISKFNAENKWKKRGISINPTMFGIGFFETKGMNQAGILCRIKTRGKLDRQKLDPLTSSYRNKHCMQKNHDDVRNDNKQQAVYISLILFYATVMYMCFALFRAAIYQASFSFYNFPPCSESIKVVHTGAHWRQGCNFKILLGCRRFALLKF